jgi:hypothetical protein
MEEEHESYMSDASRKVHIAEHPPMHANCSVAAVPCESSV